MSSMAASTFGMSEPVIVHEMAHQWWGDMITCESWQDIWLNEGWASYAEALYFETINGAASYRSYMMGMDYTYGGTIYVQDTSSTWNIFTSRVYDKGAWVLLHMLRGVVGDELFFAEASTRGTIRNSNLRLPRPRISKMSTKRRPDLNWTRSLTSGFTAPTGLTTTGR